eukprot:12864824-Heterocapsa_arctica.AAC.1
MERESAARRPRMAPLRSRVAALSTLRSPFKSAAGGKEPPSAGAQRLASLIRAVSSAMDSGVEREVAAPN